MKPKGFFVLIGIKKKDQYYKEVAAVHPFKYRGIRFFTWKNKNHCKRVHKYQIIERKTGVYFCGSNRNIKAAIQKSKKKVNKYSPEYVNKLIKKAIFKDELYNKPYKFIKL